MSEHVEVQVVRVFVAEQKNFGNPVGIVLIEKQAITSRECQNIATKLGFSETVFIDDVKTKSIRIFNPQEEINFSGHALVGAAYFFDEVLGKPVDFLMCREQRVLTWQQNGLTWICAESAQLPAWNCEQLPSIESVKNFSASVAITKKHTIIWAWLNQSTGTITARTFAPDWGIPEDEANGSGVMQLAKNLDREIIVHHGQGSVIYARPMKGGMISLGGRVTVGKTRYVTD